MENRLHKKILLGLGLDTKDGHVRVTKGKNFRLYGGSEETHEFMQDKAVKFNEALDKKGKTLDNINKEEFYDIASKIGLKINENKDR
ncbi:MAG: hypothetical protein KKD29_04475 [Candidatus Omnitrophica bacterium]|nr:hypothetical protein [Candidatus Omnitrophota bacterium]MBU4488725.1 hypothetical protein [Candidatus Omnitrophota bacterium]MCG2705822.1 hypothetical protein [Candidatus Omnitrophota bacterium]